MVPRCFSFLRAGEWVLHTYGGDSILCPSISGSSLSIPGVVAIRAAQPIHQKWEVSTWRMIWKRFAYLGLSEISILGHSNSGAIALSYAERFPSRVSKLVLIDSQVLGLSAATHTQEMLQERAKDPRFKAAVKVVSTFLSGQANFAQNDESLELFIDQALPLYLYKPEKTLALLKQHISGPISSYAFASQFAADAANRTDLTQGLDRITAKVLITVGRHDYICPLALSEHLHKGIPQSQLAIFEESGHFPWLEEPEKFFAILNGFLSP